MSEPTPPTDDELISDVLLCWEERFERGEDVSPGDLCPDRPELVPVLAARIDLLRRVAWVKNDPTAPTAGSHTPPAEPLAGRYRLDGLIGEGGFGQVWRGFDLQLQRTVAVKVPRPDRLRRATVGEDAILAEARKVARLAHPGIVPVFDVGRHGDVTFVVSELIDGNDLGWRLKCDPVPLTEGVRIVAEAARHLHFAHQEGFVHRDVKPANLIIGRDGRVFVSDFGIAVSSASPRSNRNGYGTLAYMPPERFTDTDVGLDFREDVYGLGIVLYEVLTGRRPFVADTPDGLLKAILGRDPPPPTSLNPAVPPDVERACLRCLAKDPDDRYPTAEALADDLCRCLAGGEQADRELTRLRSRFDGPVRAVVPRSGPANRRNTYIRRTEDTWIDELFARPRRLLSTDEIKQETARLLVVCAEQGFEAVLPEVTTCWELLESLADACRKTGQITAAQYLDYIARPHD